MKTAFVQAAPKPDPAVMAQLCVCFNLRKAVRAVTQFYDAMLEPTGLRTTQLTVLVALALAQRVPLSRIAERLVMDRTTLTRNLRPLERRRLVRIERGPDRRERFMSLTGAGRAAMERALPLWQAAQSRIVGGGGAKRWAGLRAELEGMVGTAQRAVNAPG
jgi:DNA-binding MarR family transcriptional regulator